MLHNKKGIKMRKLAIALAISLLPISPIFAVPAEAGVWTCKKRSHTYKGRTWTSNNCVYSNKGSSK